MKRLLRCLSALTLLFSLCATALAEGDYPTAGDLYQAWFQQNGYEHPYPDYITGVWSANGTEQHLVFGITKDERGVAGKDEILRLVADDSTVSFAYQSYSYNELLAVQQEITPLMGDPSGIYACGIYDMENVVKISIDESSPQAEPLMEELFARFGDKISFEKMDGEFVTLEDTRAESSRDKGGAADPVFVAGSLLTIASAILIPVFIGRARRKENKR